MCTEEFESLDLVDFGGVAISVESVIEVLFTCMSFLYAS